MLVFVYFDDHHLVTQIEDEVGAFLDTSLSQLTVHPCGILFIEVISIFPEISFDGALFAERYVLARRRLAMLTFTVFVDERREITRHTHLTEKVDHGFVGVVLARDIVLCVREAMRCETCAFVTSFR
jgi:hypothetical protein